MNEMGPHTWHAPTQEVVEEVHNFNVWERLSSVMPVVSLAAVQSFV